MEDACLEALTPLLTLVMMKIESESGKYVLQSESRRQKSESRNECVEDACLEALTPLLTPTMGGCNPHYYLLLRRVLKQVIGKALYDLLGTTYWLARVKLYVSQPICLKFFL